MSGFVREGTGPGQARSARALPIFPMCPAGLCGTRPRTTPLMRARVRVLATMLKRLAPPAIDNYIQ